jgi:hypothetical protein
MTSKDCQLTKTVQAYFQKEIVRSKSSMLIIATVFFFFS